MKWIKELIHGVPARGIPVHEIATSVHTCWPDKMVPAGKWHEVIYNELQKVQDKLREH